MTGTPRRQLILLIAAVLVVDGVFVAAYFVGGIWDGSNTGKVVFTVVWTLATLVIVLGGMSRIRAARNRPK
jgi:hypothetical protein